MLNSSLSPFFRESVTGFHLCSAHFKLSLILRLPQFKTVLCIYSHLYPNKHQEVVDMMQNQHRLDETATPAAMLNNTGPNATKFKVVSPNGIMSSKQAHEKRGA